MERGFITWVLLEKTVLQNKHQKTSCLAQEHITGYSKVSVVSDDSYSAELTADEVKEDGKVYLLNEEDSLRLVVFGDENSKRSVSNVVQIVVE